MSVGVQHPPKQHGPRRALGSLGSSVCALLLVSCSTGACGGSTAPEAAPKLHPRLHTAAPVSGSEAPTGTVSDSLQAPHPTPAPAAGGATTAADPTASLPATDGAAGPAAPPVSTVSLFSRADSSECARLFPLRTVRMVRHGFIVEQELRAALARIREVSGGRAEVVLLLEAVTGLYEAGHLEWIQTGIDALLRTGARMQVVSRVAHGDTHAFVIDQPWTGDPVLVRRAVMRRALAGGKPQPGQVALSLEQLQFSPGAKPHVVALDGCAPLAAGAERVRAWAHAHQVSFDAVEYRPPLRRPPPTYRGVDLSTPEFVAGPHIEDLRILMGKLYYRSAQDTAALYEITSEVISRLTARAEPLDLLLTLQPAYRADQRRATLKLMSQAGRAFLQAHPEHRIALGVGKDAIVLPFTTDVARFEATLKTLAKPRYPAWGPLDRAYRAASKLKWAAQAEHVIVSAVDVFPSLPFGVDSLDWIADREVHVHFIEHTMRRRGAAWNPDNEALRTEHCLLVEADPQATWPGGRAPVARCDLESSALAPPKDDLLDF